MRAQKSDDFASYAVLSIAKGLIIEMCLYTEVSVEKPHTTKGAQKCPATCVGVNGDYGRRGTP